MKFNNDDVAALIGTFIIHLVVFFLLYFGVMKASVPPNDSSIPVFFDMNALAVASPAPPVPVATQSETTPPTPKTPATASKETPSRNTRTPASTQRTPTTRTAARTPAPQNITQDKVETVSTEPSGADEAARIEREAAERKRIEEQQKEAISNQVNNAFGAISTQQNNQRETAAQTTTQSNPFSNQSLGSNQTSEPFGSFNLSGRSLVGDGKLPRPSDMEREEGKIVINITVDPNGNVINAVIGRGTNIDNKKMRDSAIDAANRAKFSKISGSNNQSGTITYTYKLT